MRFVLPILIFALVVYLPTAHAHEFKSPSISLELRPVIRTTAVEMALRFPIGEIHNELVMSVGKADQINRIRLAIIPSLKGLPATEGLVKFARTIARTHAIRLAFGYPESDAANRLADWAMTYMSAHGFGAKFQYELNKDFVALQTAFDSGPIWDRLKARYKQLISKVATNPAETQLVLDQSRLDNVEKEILQQKVSALRVQLISEAMQRLKARTSKRPTLVTDQDCAALLHANDNARMARD